MKDCGHQERKTNVSGPFVRAVLPSARLFSRKGLRHFESYQIQRAESHHYIHVVLRSLFQASVLCRDI